MLLHKQLLDFVIVPTQVDEHWLEDQELQEQTGEVKPFFNVNH